MQRVNFWKLFGKFLEMFHLFAIHLMTHAVLAWFLSNQMLSRMWMPRPQFQLQLTIKQSSWLWCNQILLAILKEKWWAIQCVLPPLPVSKGNMSTQEFLWGRIHWNKHLRNTTQPVEVVVLYQITFSFTVLGVDVMVNWYFNHLRRWLQSRQLVPVFLTPCYWNTCSMCFLTLHVISLFFGCHLMIFGRCILLKRIS